MKHCSLFGLLAFVLLLVSCSDTDEPSFSFSQTVGQTLAINSEAGARRTVAFESSQSWQAEVSADWLSVSPTSGEAGNNSITLQVTQVNNTGEPRKATLRLTSGSVVQEFSVEQNDYIRVLGVEGEKKELTVQPAGGNVTIDLVSSLDADDVLVYASQVDWIGGEPRNTTRAVTEYRLKLSLYVQPNEGAQRSTTYYFVKDNPSQADQLTSSYLEDSISLASVTLVQLGKNAGESEDYEHDKEVNVIQRHSAGQGIPLVLMGDGFIDREIESGYYNEVMHQAVENLFSEEPIHSLREYFDIYAVTVVSPTNVFSERRNTALECWLEGNGSTAIEGNDDAVVEYAEAVEGINVYEAQIVVLLNTGAYAGTNYFYTTEDRFGNISGDFAIAYCPVIDNLESEDFRRVLSHEAAGHGIGKLNDEYAYRENGAMPADEIAATREQRQQFGWWMNVDFTDVRQDVLWSDFLFDPRYEGQGLGIFEGACTYWTGAYRPTEESMMNGNTLGFNAPSRRAIFNHILRRAGEGTPTLEEFIDFDRQTYVPADTRGVPATPSRPFARPVVRHLNAR